MVIIFIFMVTYLPPGQCASGWLELAGVSTNISTNIVIKLFSNFVLLFVSKFRDDYLKAGDISTVVS